MPTDLSLGKWEQKSVPDFSQRDIRIPGCPVQLETGKVGKGNNTTSNNLNRNQRATIITAINGAPALC